MSGKKKSKIVSFISIIIFLLVIVFAVGLIFRYTKAGDKIKDLVNPAFRVEYGGIDYKDGNNEIVLPKDGQVKFNVKGVESYKVRVTPNVTSETDFSYEIGNEVYIFGEADLNKFFVTDNSIKNGYFVIDCTQDLSIESVLSEIHGGAEIKLNGKVDVPYLLTFASGENIVSFMFGGDIKVSLSENNIKF